MKPELDALEAWLGRPLPTAFVATLEQYGGRLVEPGLLLYAADELLERNRTFETSLYCPGYLAIGDDSGGRAVMMALGGHRQALFLVDHGAMTPDCFNPWHPAWRPGWKPGPASPNDGETPMIPFGLSPEQFRERYRRDLQRAAPGVIQRLRELLRQPLEDGLRDGEIQLFLGEDGRDAAEAWLYLSGASNRVDASDPRLFPGKALDLALGLGHAPDFDEAYFADGFGGVDLLADTLKAWFAECWWKAGGWAWPIPLWLHVHDGFGDGRGIPLTERC